MKAAVPRILDLAGTVREAVPVLMYHALSAAHTPEFEQWTLSPALLEAHLKYLSERGYRSVTVTELAQRHRAATTGAGARLVALTFDDAYADFHAVALPLLGRYGLTATLFVPSGYVGGRSGWMDDEGEGQRAVLSWQALAEIAGCGIEIGAHSHTHPRLDRLTNHAVAEEVRRPRTLLEDHLGVAVRSFAYPYGHYDRRVRDAVATAGYQSACTMSSWAATKSDHPLELPRTAVLSGTDAADFAAGLAASRSRARRTVLRVQRAAAARARRGRAADGTTGLGTAS